jgi:hypothetical protein
VQWRVQSGDGNVANGVFTAGNGGRVVLEATSGQASGTKNIHVIGAAEIRAIKASPSTIKLSGSAQPVSFSFTIQTIDGNELPLDNQYITLRTDCGAISNGVFTPFDERSKGVVTASYQGLTVDIPVRSDSSQFIDTEGHWANEQINDLADAGVINGFEDGTYRPAQPVTRAQMVTLLARQAQWPPWEDARLFSDTIPDWARGSVTAAAARGVISGYPDNTFQPNRSVTRAEVAVILDKALSLPVAGNRGNFTDAAQIPAWAADSINRVVAAGFIKGYDDGTLRPGANLTRAEIAVLLMRIMDSNMLGEKSTPQPGVGQEPTEQPVSERPTTDRQQTERPTLRPPAEQVPSEPVPDPTPDPVTDPNTDNPGTGWLPKPGLTERPAASDNMDVGQ